MNCARTTGGIVRRKNAWSDQEIATAVQIYERWHGRITKVALCQMIAKKIGRTYSSVYQRLHLYGPLFQGTRAGNTAEQSGYGRPPDEVLAEREYRERLPHRDLTAAVCGDPKPGYSALDRRR